MSLFDHCKRIFWFLALPFFPIIRDVTRKFGYSPYPERQEYHLGWLAFGKRIADFNNFLKSKGFKKNIVAWIDQEEVLSLRLRENFKYQYHLRLFSDREIRGHYELTPEYSPFGHLHDEGTTAEKEWFQELLGDWLAEDLNQEK